MEFAGKKSALDEQTSHEFEYFCQKVEDNAQQFKDYIEELDDEKTYYD
jgi:hypothetical protein